MRDFNYRNQIILNNKNYHDWRKRTASILKAERVYTCIDRDPRFIIHNDRNAKAVEIINRLLDKEHQFLVQDCEAAKDIWEKLENLYNDYRKQDLKLKGEEILKRLQNYKMSKAADTVNTVDTLNNILRTLVEIDVLQLTEDECIDIVKKSMQERFYPFENLWTVICNGGSKLEILNAIITGTSTLVKQLSSKQEERKKIEGVEIELTRIPATAPAFPIEAPPTKKARIEEKEIVLESDSRCEKQKPPKENYEHKKERRPSSSADSAKHSDAKRQSSSSSRSSLGCNYEKKQRDSLKTPSSSATLSGQATTTSTSETGSEFSSTSTSASASAPASAPASVQRTPEKRRISESRDKSVTLERSRSDSCVRNDNETSPIKLIDATKISGTAVIKSPKNVTNFSGNPTSSAVIVTKTNSAGQVINVPAITLNTNRSAKKMTESELSRVGISAQFLSPAKFSAQSKAPANREKENQSFGESSNSQASTPATKGRVAGDTPVPINIVRHKIPEVESNTSMAPKTIEVDFQLRPGYISSFTHDKSLLQNYEEFEHKVHRATTLDPELLLETYGKGEIVTTRGKFTAYYTKGINIHYLSPDALNEQQPSQAQPNPSYNQKITSMLERDDNIIRLEVILGKIS